MYCDKINVNQLTSLLVAHGLREVVVCPGSRNAIMAHNFDACPVLSCYPITDERSAAFFALGLAQ
ncbi:MAG: 2-succinyl-5-enolpyruvyl-6-hydroxy-3-cyclohexene-1-carboxylic-acid synthase, partial [Bacteroidaceae bacterium]